MSIYVVTGKPGAGKSTAAVGRAINEYAAKGRRIAANFPMDFAPVANNRKSPLSSAHVWVMPDRPARADFDALGFGGDSEETAGLLIIDEAGVFFNARNWQGSGREEVIDWMVQSRKRYWDILIIVQSHTMLDKQIRDAVCEMHVAVRRLDRKKILGFKLPRFHIGVVRYGLGPTDPLLERWFYSGDEAHKCFNSYRLFSADTTGHYCTIPATISKWRTYKTRIERLRAWWQADGRPPSLPLADPHPLVALLRKLPEAERLKHWRRLEALGAFN